MNMEIIKRKNTELIKEKNNLIEIMDKKEKINKKLISALKEENNDLKNQIQNEINEKIKIEELIKEKEKEKRIIIYNACGTHIKHFF